MLLDASSIALLVVAFAGVWAVTCVLDAVRIGKAMPPGPKGLPLIGNLLELPRKLQWLQFSAWAEQYGKYVPR